MSCARGHGSILFFIFIKHKCLLMSFILLREVIPGASSLLSNFITLSSMEASIAIGVQAVPVNKQEYNPYRRLYMQVTSHHVIFNHQDLLLQLVSIKINSQIDISTFSLHYIYVLTKNIMHQNFFYQKVCRG